MHEGPRGTNILDSGAPYYDVYACADGKYVSIAPIEAKFRERLFTLLGLPAGSSAHATDSNNWPTLRAELAARFKSETRAHWCLILESSDACFAPVLSMAEAPDHPHQQARKGFIDIDGVVQPAPAPRFGRTASAPPTAPEAPGESTDTAMREWGYSDDEIGIWKRQGALRTRSGSAQSARLPKAQA